MLNMYQKFNLKTIRNNLKLGFNSTILKGCIILSISLFISVICLGINNLIPYLFLPNKLVYNITDLSGSIKDMTLEENGLLVSLSDDPWITIKLPAIINISQLNVYASEIKNNNENSRVYYDIGNITGQKYVDFCFINGESNIFFSNNTKAGQLRLDLTSVKNNSFRLEKVVVTYNNIIRRQFLALSILIFLLIFVIVTYYQKIKIFLIHLIRNKYFMFMIFFTIMLFLALYGKYIWSGVLYGFTDVGSDTYYGYLPLYYTMMDKISSMDLSIYNLMDGIGNSYMAGANVNMELPFVFILCLFGKENIYHGILFCSLIKIIILETITFFYLKELGINSKVSSLCTILWGFCGFNIVWGQHPFFLTAMVVFSTLMLIIEKIIRKGNQKLWVIFSTLVGMYSINNFYFLYSCLATTGVYYFCRQVFLKRSFKQIIKAICLYFFFSLLGIGALLFISSEWLICMLESARDISLQKISLIDFNIQNFVSVLGRLLSSQIFGVKNYTGLQNIYEDPLLSTSVLLIISCYWLCKRNKKNIIFIGLLCIASFSPLASKIFIMLRSNRWMYIFSFLSVVAIALFINDIMVNNQRLNIVDLVLLSIVCIILFVSLYWGSISASININMNAFIFKAVLLSIYLIIFYFVKIPDIYYSLAILIFIEICGSNFNLINNRVNVGQDEYSEFIDGDTKQLIDEIKENEKNQLYRIRALNYRNFLNHSQIGEYIGTNSYSSLNKKYSIEFISNLEESDSAYALSHDPNHFDISCENYAIQTLLGVKYVITDSEPPEGYTIYAETNTVKAYLNQNALPMGIVYKEKMNKNQYLSLSILQKNMALFKAYYESEDDNFIPVKRTDIFDLYISNSFNIKNKNIYGTNTDNNNTIFIKRNSTGQASEMNIEMTVPKSGLFMKIYYAEKNQTFNNEQVIYRFLIEGTRNYSIYFDSPNVEQIKIIPILSDENTTYDFIIHNISFFDWQKQYKEEYQILSDQLSHNTVVNSGFNNDIYKAYYNNEESESLLFIPLSYSLNWSATVNKKPVEVQNINDAFCGIKLPLGECRIEMKYKTLGQPLWLFISITCFIILLIFYINSSSKEKKVDVLINTKKYKVEK